MMIPLCLSTNLKSSDLAAWVQAVGSILAILASAGLVFWQMKHAQKLDRKRALSTHEFTMEAFYESIDQCISLWNEVKEKANAGYLENATNNEFLSHRVVFAGDQLKSCRQLPLRSVRIGLLIDDLMNHYTSARNDVFRDFLALERGEKLEPGLNPRARLDDILNRLANFRVTIVNYDMATQKIL